MIGALANKYARALAEVALDQGTETAVELQLGTFAGLLSSHRELRQTLRNPAIPFVAKREIVEGLARRIPFDRVVTNFLLVILENNRMRHFRAFMDAFREVLDEKEGIVRGAVRTATALDEQARMRLEQAVSSAVKKRVNLSYEQDPSLIGGLKLQVGSTIYDGSVQTQLETIRARLASA